MRAVYVCAIVVGLLGCGGKEEEPPRTAVAAKTATGPKPGDPDPGDGRLRRSQVKSVVSQGLGAFLQKVTVDDRPVFLSGRFHGFRIVQLRGDLAETALRPGDVITRVNGMTIERPEQALEAFRSLEISSELRIDYEREGELKELRWAIVEDPPVK